MYVRTVTVAGDCPTASDAVFEQTKVLENRKVGPKREKKTTTPGSPLRSA